ncbi:MAG: hypothetical protein HYX95_02945 [Chloroflexi bacterium]|nr:hypothetical protein [Chloroflexota bacterium]
MKKLLHAMSGVLWALLAAGALSGAALAHVERDVGRYRLEVGFLVEPVIEGQINGLDLRVTSGKVPTVPEAPVLGLEKTLKVEVTHVPSNASRVFSVQAIDEDRQPGHYSNVMVLTAPGQYRFRIFGTIEGLAVNETFTSGPDTFSNVETAASLEFPIQVPGARELASAASGADARARKAQDSADQSNTMAKAGIILGGAGLVMGVVSLAVALRKK